MRTVIRPFEAAHPGILVRYYAVRTRAMPWRCCGRSALTPNIDVVILDPPNARLAQSEGLLEQMNPQLVPNAADLGAMGRELGFWALPAMYDSMALVYAKSAFAAAQELARVVGPQAPRKDRHFDQCQRQRQHDRADRAGQSVGRQS